MTFQLSIRDQWPEGDVWGTAYAESSPQSAGLEVGITITILLKGSFQAHIISKANVFF